MTLEEYRKLEGLSYSRLGELIGVNAETVRRYCLPEWEPLARMPDRARLRRIRELTLGQVRPDDFVA